MCNLISEYGRYWILSISQASISKYVQVYGDQSIWNRCLFAFYASEEVAKVCHMFPCRVLFKENCMLKIVLDVLNVFFLVNHSLWSRPYFDLFLMLVEVQEKKVPLTFSVVSHFPNLQYSMKLIWWWCLNYEQIVWSSV